MGIRINDYGVKYFCRFYLILINLILEFLIELPKVFFMGFMNPHKKLRKNLSRNHQLNPNLLILKLHEWPTPLHLEEVA